MVPKMKWTFIAVNTYKEVVRDKIYALLFAFAIGLVWISYQLGALSVGESRKIILDVSYGAMFFIGGAVSVFVGISLVYREIEKKTLYNILSKPISRAAFVVGKFVGLSTALVVMECSMILIMGLCLHLAGHALTWPMALACLSVWLKVEMVLAFAVLFSSLSTPILSGMFTLGFLVVGSISQSVLDLYALKGGALAGGMKALSFVIPNFSRFDWVPLAVFELPLFWKDVCLSLGYAVSYTLILLIVAVWVFDNRDFT